MDALTLELRRALGIAVIFALREGNLRPYTRVDPSPAICSPGAIPMMNSV